ncbi:hypothetical protein [Haloarchaeobius iranensis]|uniref:Uncharacterized protein n=1 Tax=Haloarchaeobius iranensis TaxID=996166 RepID=A0A1G9YGD3_9EURY|nr:hypothetical protein [Haloarchaeobius iranensis]SDN07561.1 hypothetical protein SAMN05192554_11428 [Haloarchaeobius iranensis]
MPNGKPGDSPYTDIVTHGRDVYSTEVDDLIRDLDSLGAAIDVHDVLNEYALDPAEDELDALAADLRELKREYEGDD